MGFDINRKYQTELTGFLQILWIRSEEVLLSFFLYFYVNIYIYVYIYISWTTVLGGDPDAPFPWIGPLTLDPYFKVLNVNQEGIEYIFLSL